MIAIVRVDIDLMSLVNSLPCSILLGLIYFLHDLQSFIC